MNNTLANLKTLAGDGWASDSDIDTCKKHLNYHREKWGYHADMVDSLRDKRVKQNTHTKNITAKHMKLLNHHKAIVRNLRGLLLEHTGKPE